tara:strand:- start:1474 stop:1761 length:288 start_codon:yes stop_codon:yes gene_type:complete
MANTTNESGPEYYRRGSIQPWDFIRSSELNFHLGNVIKYVCRAGHKGDDIEDLKKAIHYLQNEVEFRTGTRVQESVRSPELPKIAYPSFAEEFDR